MQQLQQEQSSQTSSVFNLTIEGFKQLQTYGIDLNHLFILECLSEGADIANHMNSSKVAAWKQNLYRKSLTTEKGEITTLGKSLLTALSSGALPGEIVKKARGESDDQFEMWWKAYPSTDIFEYKFKVFNGSRGLKQKKEDCRKKFNEILLEGEHSSEDLIRALNREVTLKKEQSVKENENKMKYMQNTATYLNQRTYENFIYPKEEIKISTPGTSSGTVDI